jgi:uncharacterized membrane protein YbhN (UPF0104 family)
MHKTKLYKYYNIGIRSAIIIAAIVLLYRELSTKSIFEYSDLLKNYFQDSTFIWIFILVLFLMPLNWSLEALKWRYIVASKEQISFSLALKAIFAGTSVSSLSPNRVGDFLGRVFVLKKVSFLQGAFITLIGSYAQTLISIILGFFAVVFLAFMHSNMYTSDLYFVFIISFLIIILFIFLYYKISILTRIVPRKWKRVYGYIQVFSQYKYPELSVILAYSLVRYIVFSTQFVLMLWAVGFHIPVLHLFVLVSAIFFINMFRPSIALIEFAVRGMVSVGVFIEYYSYSLNKDFTSFDDSNVIIASTLIWFINIILPALIGLFFIKDMKFFKYRKGTS